MVNDISSSIKTFRWTFPILHKGWKNNLKFEDCTEIPSKLRTKNLDEKFFKFYNMKKPSVLTLIWTLFKVAQNNLLTSWLCTIVMFGHYRISVSSSSMCITAGMMLLQHPHQELFNGLICEVSTPELIKTMDGKITRVSPQGFLKTNTGEIMNILTNDMNRFNKDFRFIFFVITSPLQCILVCIILWLNIGALPVIGVSGIIIMIPLQILFGKSLFKFRIKVLKATDARIKLIYEIITSMKIIKLYAWEDSFWKHLIEKRKHEFNQLRRITIFKGASCIIFKSMINVVITLSMLGFVLQNKDKISVSKVYLAITMFYSVKYSISMFFVLGLNGIAQLLSSLQRIYNFLSIEEYSPEHPTRKIHSFKEILFKDSKYRPIVKLHEVYSSYGKNTENVVKDITFKLNPGESLCVIGEVGSGKTSLMKTILKEMVVTNGSIKVRGKVAYACQQSWIFSDTLKNNILFGSKFDQERYQNVINACCLSMDINVMPNKDETVVGERGINLSGGQRARISLARFVIMQELLCNLHAFLSIEMTNIHVERHAEDQHRALYCDADVYLLDDPLSAVDAEVGNHLYSQQKIFYSFDRDADIGKVLSDAFDTNNDRDAMCLARTAQIIRTDMFQELFSFNGSFSSKCQEKSLSLVLIAMNNKPLLGTYETVLEKCPSLTTFFTDSFKNPEITTKKLEIKQALFNGKEDDDMIFKLDNIEDATSKSVSWKVYKEFFRAAGNPYLILLISISLNIIYSLIILGFDYWIKIWTEFEEQKTNLPGNLSPSTAHLGFSSDSLYLNNQNCLIILSIICLISVLCSIPTLFFDMMFCYRDDDGGGGGGGDEETVAND
ncbi:Multidrug resistance-associated protein 4 [Nymphon striatum]|nr:Multidrug resistance-associated protein 4 [Nymphon striatum]